ncbi:hypothetical protein SODALDRAFT_146705 [Sodiomyces alkalinus F11]|uniref:Uncharacterized protein n=1 Tax=Sodiomyces alkalinus (strain CBS 110278 / VKM F-3762 / F11) TaxID=1314773 RepID=A0A3N2Q030_SODAK|nr:hypothetical protein SODALDRAFT_146705 [Sodiomyces alkalinus F11]ROT40129.1 hypothetical protein SODALDRAFT_146705 [Sodiomyces alkalinus F11]
MFTVLGLAFLPLSTAPYHSSNRLHTNLGSINPGWNAKLVWSLPPFFFLLLRLEKQRTGGEEDEAEAEAEAEEKRGGWESVNPYLLHVAFR